MATSAALWEKSKNFQCLSVECHSAAVGVTPVGIRSMRVFGFHVRTDGFAGSAPAGKSLTPPRPGSPSLDDMSRRVIQLLYLHAPEAEHSHNSRVYRGGSNGIGS